jgi:hypothetical protein
MSLFIKWQRTFLGIKTKVDIELHLAISTKKKRKQISINILIRTLIRNSTMFHLACSIPSALSEQDKKPESSTNKFTTQFCKSESNISRIETKMINLRPLKAKISN